MKSYYNILMGAVLFILHAWLATAEPICTVDATKGLNYSANYDQSAGAKLVRHRVTMEGQLLKPSQAKCMQKVYKRIKSSLFPGGDSFSKKKHEIILVLKDHAGGSIALNDQVAADFKKLCNGDNCKLKSVISGSCSSACIALFLAADTKNRKIEGNSQLCLHAASAPRKVLGIKYRSLAPEYMNKKLAHKDFDSRNDRCRRTLKGASADNDYFCFNSAKLFHSRCDIFKNYGEKKLTGKKLKEYMNFMHEMDKRGKPMRNQDFNFIGGS